MAGVIKFYYNEKNEEVFEASTLVSFKIEEIDNDHLILSLNTTDKQYRFNLASDTRWQNNLDLMIEFFNTNFEKVLKGSTSCKFDTHKARYYVYFYFYEDFNDDFVDSGQFTGEYIE